MTILFPNQLDNGTSIPVAIDNVTPVKAVSVNTLRDAILAIEKELGINPSSDYSSIANRLDYMDQKIADMSGGGGGSTDANLPISGIDDGKMAYAKDGNFRYSDGVKLLNVTGGQDGIAASGYVIINTPSPIYSNYLLYQTDGKLKFLYNTVNNTLMYEPQTASNGNFLIYNNGQWIASTQANAINSFTNLTDGYTTIASSGSDTLKVISSNNILSTSVNRNTSANVVLTVNQANIDHGSISSLTDDDHTQYLLANGTRALTGSLNLDGYKIINVGTPTLPTDAINKSYVDGYIQNTTLSSVLSHNNSAGSYSIDMNGQNINNVGIIDGYNLETQFQSISNSLSTINNRNVIAGNGLTGGGNLSSDVTLNVVAGDSSITVNADSVTVGVISDIQHGSRSGGTLHSEATQSVNGFMSSIDKTKLDGIAIGSFDGYALLNGSKVYTGNMNLGGYNITNVGTVDGYNLETQFQSVTDGLTTVNNRSIIAGNGLTGGGTLSTDRTLNVVAADSTITVNADSIQVGVITDTNHGSRSGGTLHSIATTSVNGFMSSTDKTKLDSIGVSAFDGYALLNGSKTYTGNMNLGGFNITNVGTVDGYNLETQFQSITDSLAAKTSTSRTITAGNGLTGGGALTADITLNVVAGDSSLTVNADSITVGVISDTQHGSRSGGTLHSVATTSVAGFMSSVDKTKLDGIGVSAFDGYALLNGSKTYTGNMNLGGYNITNVGTVDGYNLYTQFQSITDSLATKVGVARSVIAGAGLTGGGTLSSDITLNVVAADSSITVAADSIAVGVITDTNHGSRSGGTLHSVATTSTAGFMSATDKTKLDNIAVSAFDGYALLSGSKTYTGSMNLGGFLIANLGNPVSSTDAVNKLYVDGYFQNTTLSAVLAKGNTTAGNHINFTGGSYLWSSDGYVLVNDRLDVANGITSTAGDVVLYDNINMGNTYSIINLPTPTNGTDAANKSYVDSKISTNLGYYFWTTAISNGASDGYQHLVTLPAATAGTLDGTTIEIYGGPWTQYPYVATVYFTNRDSYGGYIISNRSFNGTLKIKAFTQADNTVQIWAHLTSTYQRYNLNITSTNYSSKGALTTVSTYPPGTLLWDSSNTSASYGDVTSNSLTSTDNSLTRFDGTSGKIVQNSLAVLDDTGNLNLNSGTGTLTCGIPTLSTHAATKGYVDGYMQNQTLAAVLARGNNAGSNVINMNNQPIQNVYALTNYVTGQVLLDSTLNMNGKILTNLITPTADSDAATKAYVDSSIAGGTLSATLARGNSAGSYSINMNGSSIVKAKLIDGYNTDTITLNSYGAVAINSASTGSIALTASGSGGITLHSTGTTPVELTVNNAAVGFSVNGSFLKGQYQTFDLEWSRTPTLNSPYITGNAAGAMEFIYNRQEYRVTNYGGGGAVLMIASLNYG